MKLTADTAKAIAILAAVGAGGFLAWKLYRGGAAVLDTAGRVITQDLNPASTENVVYRGLNTITGGDNESSSIGTRIYDWLHPNG